MGTRRFRRTDRKVPPLTPCGYCFQDWAVLWDHLVPCVAGGRNSSSNLYPSCARCNGILGDKMFDSLEAKRGWMQDELKRREEWQTPEEMRCESVRTVRSGVPTAPIMAEVLSGTVPRPSVEKKAKPPRIPKTMPLLRPKFSAIKAVAKVLRPELPLQLLEATCSRCQRRCRVMDTPGERDRIANKQTVCLNCLLNRTP